MNTKDLLPIKSLIASLREILACAVGEESELRPGLRIRLESYDAALASQQELIAKTELEVSSASFDALRALELIDASATMLLEDAEDLIKEIDTVSSSESCKSHWC